MPAGKETLIDECERLVATLETEIGDADSEELFQKVQAGLMANVAPQDVVEEIIDNYCFGTPLPWEK